jgi:hypothetical protein
VENLEKHLSDELIKNYIGYKISGRKRIGTQLHFPKIANRQQHISLNFFFFQTLCCYAAIVLICSIMLAIRARNAIGIAVEFVRQLSKSSSK